MSESRETELRALLADVVRALPDDENTMWTALGYPIENHYPEEGPLEELRAAVAGLVQRLRDVLAGDQELLAKLEIPPPLCWGCDEPLDAAVPDDDGDAEVSELAEVDGHAVHAAGWCVTEARERAHMGAE